jgi:O-succinylbenzoic acid--CoA ligase
MPRLVLHDWPQHLESAGVVTRHLDVGPGSRWALSLPLHHVGGLAIIIRALVSGAAVALRGELPLEAALGRLAVTHVSMVATQLRRLLDARVPAAGPGALRAVVVGGGPLPGRLAARAHEHGLPLVHSYGATEMASMITATATAATAATAATTDRVASPPPGAPTAGRVLPGRRLSIGPAGEIRVGGPSLCRGYLDPSTGDVEDPRDAQGLHATGDRGALAPDGELMVLGRQDGMMISGGENIQAEEVEEALRHCAGVRDALVIALADDAFGERPAAFVVMEDGRALDADAIRGALATRLARFKIPEHLWAWPDDARPGAERLKPDRREMARLGERLAGRSREAGQPEAGA